MSDTIAKVEEPNPTIPPNSRKFSFNIAIVISLIFWIYFIANTFIINIDYIVLKHVFPNYTWLLNYKFVATLVIISALLIIRNKVFGYLLHILFFPLLIFVYLILLFWRTKNWLLAFSLVDFIVEGLSGFKRKFILLTLWTISVVLVFLSNEPMILYIACIPIMVYLINLYLSSFLKPLRKSVLFDGFSRLATSLTKSKLIKDMIKVQEDLKGKELIALDEKQIVTYTNGLQMAVIVHRGLIYIANKLSIYKKSRFYIYNIAISFLYLLVISTILFSVINYAFYKAAPGNFVYTGTFGWFDFLFYSFFSMFFGASDAVAPNSIVTQSFKMLLPFSAVIIISTLILNFSFLIWGDKYKEDIDELAETLNKNGRHIEDFIGEEYQMSIVKAINTLYSLKAGLISWIFKLSEDLPELNDLRKEQK